MGNGHVCVLVGCVIYWDFVIFYFYILDLASGLLTDCIWDWGIGFGVPCTGEFYCDMWRLFPQQYPLYQLSYRLRRLHGISKLCQGIDLLVSLIRLFKPSSSFRSTSELVSYELMQLNMNLMTKLGSPSVLSYVSLCFLIHTYNDGTIRSKKASKSSMTTSATNMGRKCRRIWRGLHFASPLRFDHHFR